MFTTKTSPEKTGLEKAIDRLHDDMQTVDPDSDQYAKMADNLTKLYKLRECDKPERRGPSPDTLALITANLIGIGIIVGYEQKHVVTSKALGFLKKLV